MSLTDKLPIEVCRHIYDFDKTYRDVLKESLNFIEHAVQVCTCSGLKFSSHNRPWIYQIFYNNGPFSLERPQDFRWFNGCKCDNKCPKHNPSAYDREFYDWFWDYNPYDLLPIIASPNYSIGSPYYKMKMRQSSTQRYCLFMCWLLYSYSEWLILRRLHNNVFRKGRCKKQSWSRFMDMSHNQRTIVA